MERRRLLGPLAALLLPIGLTSAGCRASDEAPTPAPIDDGDTPAAQAAADAARIEGSAEASPAGAADGDPTPAKGADAGDPAVEHATIEEGRLARIDARLLDLQAAVNQLDVAGADRAECESRWEELDGRRAALRREEQTIDDELTASDRDERRRTLAEDLDDLESDLETAIQEVESRLARG